MAISNFFPLTSFLLETLSNSKKKRKKKKLGRKKKVQIILQTSGKSVKEDMALLLAWCGSENRNVWSALVFGSMACPDLRNTFRERGAEWLAGVVFISIHRSACQNPPKLNLTLSANCPHLHAIFVIDSSSSSSS